MNETTNATNSTNSGGPTLVNRLRGLLPQGLDGLQKLLAPLSPLWALGVNVLLLLAVLALLALNERTLVNFGLCGVAMVSSQLLFWVRKP